MAIQFTKSQTRVLNARHHNILVSAAAGSGKTAVLVERIIRMISEDDPPRDIDRLLIVTFTRAAAGEMRERIAKAISKRLEERPDDRHLQRQETLLHRAQITTIDSFCTFLLRNNFSEVDLDPGFRQIDENEAALIAGECLQRFLEEQYSAAMQGDTAAGSDIAPEGVDAAPGRGDASMRRDAGSESSVVPAGVVDRQRFFACVEYFCPGSDDAGLEKLIRKLYEASSSHPYPEAWLEERKKDYVVSSEEELFECGWYRLLLQERLETLRQTQREYQVLIAICRESDGPDVYLETIAAEEEGLYAGLREWEGRHAHRGEAADPAEEIRCLRRLLLEASLFSFKSLPPIRKKADRERIDAGKKKRAQDLRGGIKERIRSLGKGICEDPTLTLQRMQAAAGPIGTLIDLTLGYMDALRREKREKNVIDFSDLEHYALQVLIERKPDGTLCLRKAARSYREYYDEVLIDEYQDSNEVQELLLSAITGEPDAGFADAPPVSFDAGAAGAGSYARFMVGDVKQSIYRFRNARPEIFQQKFDTYAVTAKQDLTDPADGSFDTKEPLTAAQKERIDLDQNFRSRRQVLDAANGVCGLIMRREVGGVEYDETAALKQGAFYPASEAGRDGSDPYQAELLLVDGQKKSFGGDAGSSGPAGRAGRQDGDDAAEEAEEDGGPGDSADEIAEMNSFRKEALAVAQRIRELVGVLPIYDRDTGEQHPARYGDIVILMRSASGRQDAYREIFEKEGIPLYLEYKGGYFAAEEVRTVLQLLNVIDNPRQDIPLYGVMRGYYGGFSQDEIAQIRALGRDADRYAAGEDAEASEGEGCSCAQQAVGQSCTEGGKLYGSLLLAADCGGPGGSLFAPALREKCARFLTWLNEWRERARSMTVSELIGQLVRSTGYEDYVRALPAGARRAANLRSLLVKADAFERSDRAGLFRFLRYIEEMHTFDVDFGEASVLDEHADVVRLTTIHKSKGLEYPVCIVSGLGTKYAYKRDTSGTLILDADLGLGTVYTDTALRCSVKTLRQMAVADKIDRDSLGEELRVLYVAMTRAKEKLILTGYTDDAADLLDKIRVKMVSVDDDAPHLPVSLIRGSGNYLTLILESMEMMRAKGREPIRMQTVQVSDLRLAQLEDHLIMDGLRSALILTEQGDLSDLPSPEIAQRLERHYTYRYPYENLAGLYTKTTVTELKRAAMIDAGLFGETGEVPAEMYPEEMYQGGVWEDPESLAGKSCNDAADAKESTAFPLSEELPKPRFAMEDEFRGAGDAGASDAAGRAGVPQGTGILTDAGYTDVPKAGVLTGAARGTAVHCMCKRIDYRVWNDPSKVTARMFEDRVAALLGAGEIPSSYASVLKARLFLPFLHSGVALRMARADAKGLLVREQPFVLGISANRLNPQFPEEETILIQGIIDAFFIEEDEEAAGDGTEAAAAIRPDGAAAGLYGNVSKLSAAGTEEGGKVSDVGVGAFDDREERYYAESGRHIVLVDYKTDRVKTGQELIDRYRVQIEYYAEALERMLRLPVTERILYSFALQEEIYV